MSTGPSVTIITVTHDHEPFIGPCIESVLAQSRDDWELVVVDDGSSDGTLDMVNRYRDARIQTLALPARGLVGLAESYNAALERSRGPLPSPSVSRASCGWRSLALRPGCGSPAWGTFR